MTLGASPRLSLLVPEIIALLGGIVSAVIIALPINTFFHFIYFETIVLAPLVEETAKASGVTFLALSYPSALMNKTRGLLLGGLAGLGFAFTENLFYATIPGTDVVARALLPVPMHIMASGIAGMGFVYVAHERIKPHIDPSNDGPASFKLRNVVSLFLVAVIIHTQFNMLSYFGYSGSALGLMIASFVYYRLGKALPEDLQFFTVPGPVKLLSSTVRVRVLQPPFPTAMIPPSRPDPLQKNVYCIMCGHAISHGETFCARCGESQV
jgi:RsiW-degrading membrane proteinase PrsW (M82 family)